MESAIRIKYWSGIASGMRKSRRLAPRKTPAEAAHLNLMSHLMDSLSSSASGTNIKDSSIIAPHQIP